MKYDRSSPSQTGCAEIPISTNTIAPLSNSDRGRRAERIPIGSAISIQRMAPPMTSEIGHGRGRLDDLVHLLARRERAAERGRLRLGTGAVEGDGRQRVQEAEVLLPDRIVQVQELAGALDGVGRRLRAGHEPGGLGRDEEEDDVRDHRDGDEEHEGPEKSPDEIPEHSVSLVGRRRRRQLTAVKTPKERVEGRGSRGAPRRAPRLWIRRAWTCSTYFLQIVVEVELARPGGSRSSPCSSRRGAGCCR